MNIPLLEQAKKAILDEPKRLEMDDYFRPSSTSPCGTTACIAGHVIIADRLNTVGKTFRNKRFIKSIKWVNRGSYTGDDAERLLSITQEQRNQLFHVVNWPDQFRSEYDNAKSSKLRARIAAKRIDHFIATDGRE